MGTPFLLLLLCFVLLSAPLIHAGATRAVQSDDGSEEWGYVRVRPKAYMFWWLYRSPYRVEDPSKPWPIIIWLQGGPGTSGVGLGNFNEIGPLDSSLKPRNSTWLHKADLLFVDNPVGTGYSFVEDTKLLVKSDLEAAVDLTTLLRAIFNGDERLQKSPLYIMAESYGGRYAVTLGLSVLKAIEAGTLKLTLGGVAFGNSWISPQDLTYSWGPLLKDMSRLDDNGLQEANSVAERIGQQIQNGQFVAARSSWSELEDVISSCSNGVNFYNFLLDSGEDLPWAATAMDMSNGVVSMKRYSRYLNSLMPTLGGDFSTLMNGVVRKKLKIIPKNITWHPHSDYVSESLGGDFMKPRINEIDELLAKGVEVTIYNGQVDLISSTKGTEAWVHKLKWEGLQAFLMTERTPLYCGRDGYKTKGFTKSYKNLHFYWILGAGHFVPVDQPCVALDMVGVITQSPAVIAHM